MKRRLSDAVTRNARGKRRIVLRAKSRGERMTMKIIITPDAGGTHEAMLRINEAYERLRFAA
jgi:hypothetical protein